MHHLCNPGDAGCIVNKVLSNLDPDMRQVEFFRMMVNRKVLGRLARVRLIVADKLSRIAKSFEKDIAHRLVLVP